MQSYSISQVAERTGFPASTLRYYEQHGLVHPDRTPTGYRSYDDHHLEQLGFIGRAKGFGLTLEEITELLDLLEQDRCSPVQDRLRALVATKMVETDAKVAQLIAFTDELRRVAAALDGPPPDGPCDESCGCVGDTEMPTTIALGTGPGAEVPVACTLTADQVGLRLAEWRSWADLAVSRHEITGGVRMRFPSSVDVVALASLVAAEQRCCPFFTFALTVAGAGVALDITAPTHARTLVDSLLGGAA